MFVARLLKTCPEFMSFVWRGDPVGARRVKWHARTAEVMQGQQEHVEDGKNASC